jgi:hypothetical protein
MNCGSATCTMFVRSHFLDMPTHGFGEATIENSYSCKDYTQFVPIIRIKKIHKLTTYLYGIQIIYILVH